MNLPWSERAVSIACAGQQLVGVVAGPEGRAQGTGVVIVVGGPQYRAGSHRLFVKLARALAAAGHAVLRFDVRGMGDSEGEFPGFEQLSPDIGAAIDALQARCPDVKRVVLWGLCDGASAALLHLHASGDARVRGLCLLNPWVRSTQSLARTHVKHYYVQRLLQPAFWRKLLSGGVGTTALRGLGTNLHAALGGSRAGTAGTKEALTFQQRMAQAWQRFDGDLLLLLSGDDYTAKEFLEHCAGDAVWQDALRHPRLRREELAQADHTFSGAAASAWVLEHTLAWLRHTTISSTAVPVQSAALFEPR